MSLAIGSWLYDASADYSKSSQQVNQAMLNAFKFQSKEYDQTPEGAMTNINIQKGYIPFNNVDSTNTKINTKKIKNPKGVPSHMQWVLK